ncbi:acyl carrier protein [Nocardia sp. NBC_01499]|uniref:acyl carrier protein n=1 Tax=Nocardia sp. NBC_01499 TaxID=2903597 RepID=UPI00386F2A33
MTTSFDIDTLREILLECAGELEGIEQIDNIADTEFDDLGYDSIALLETAARVEQRFGIKISDDAFDELTTPRAFVEYVVAELVPAEELLSGTVSA